MCVSVLMLRRLLAVLLLWVVAVCCCCCLRLCSPGLPPPPPVPCVVVEEDCCCTITVPACGVLCYWLLVLCTSYLGKDLADAWDVLLEEEVGRAVRTIWEAEASSRAVEALLSDSVASLVRDVAIDYVYGSTLATKRFVWVCRTLLRLCYVRT